MSDGTPQSIDPTAFVDRARTACEADVRRAIQATAPTARDLAYLLSPAAGAFLEPMAQRARTLTRRHFGRTISLYVPLYLSNFCPGGCAYCGFAGDRELPRRRLTEDETVGELDALKAMGFEEVLLLTGERTPEASFEYVERAVRLASERIHKVTVEAFAMETDEYAALARAGCTGVTLYQETYDAELYEQLHRWGPKRDYANRVAAPSRALHGGIRTVGLGALLGLSDPIADLVSLFLHLEDLRKQHWDAGFTVSFPRIQPQLGGFKPQHAVDDRMLAQAVFAFRICLPDVPLVLSTRETAALRDGMAGLGISKMSVASRTTVGGYGEGEANDETGQFEVSDDRDTEHFCAALRERGLAPVFKNWDTALYEPAVPQTAEKS